MIRTPAWLRLSRVDAVGLAVLAVLALAVYAPAFRAGFIWDDDYHLTGNPFVTSWRGLLEIWTSRSAMYYPLTLTTFWGLHKAVGLHPFPYHALNVILHVANAFLVWRVLRELRAPGGFLAALLFLVHPVQVESVAWVTELKNTQSGFFALLAFLCLVRSGLLGDHASSTGPVIRHGWYRAGWVLFALALLSKTAVVMVPAVMLAGMLCLERNWRWARVEALAPLFALSALAAGWTIWEQRYSSGASGFEWDLSAVERVALAGRIFWFYVGKVVWPFPVMFQYPAWPVSPVTPWGLFPAAAALAAIGLPLLLRGDRARFVFLAVASFGLMVFPVLGLFNIYFFRYAFVADHFLYLAAIPLFALIAAGLVRAAAWAADKAKVPEAAGVLAVSVIACLPLAAGAFRHARTFHDAETLWRAAIASNPGAWLAHNNLGLILQNRNELEAAREHYLSALEANPHHYEAMTNLGTLLMDEGRIGEARDLFRRASALQPANPVHRVNLGYAEFVLGQVDEAIGHYRAVLAERPAFAPAWLKLAAALEKNGGIEESARAYEEALTLNGHTRDEIAGYFATRGVQALRNGRADEARAWLDQAERIRPEMPAAAALRAALP